MSFDELIKLALTSIKESMDEDITKENVRIAYIRSSEGNKFKICNKDEVQKFISQL